MKEASKSNIPKKLPYTGKEKLNLQPLQGIKLRGK